MAVIDPGIGITAEELRRVTEKFYRGKGVTHSHNGSGLGLYLANDFVGLHGGALASSAASAKERPSRSPSRLRPERPCGEGP